MRQVFLCVSFRMSHYPKSVLITGASRGIGRGFVEQFLKHDEVEHIFAAVRNPDTATELNEITDARVTVVKLDVECDETIKSAFKTVEKIVGDEGLNCLINNAGNVILYPIEEAPNREKLEEQMSINLISQIMVTQHFLPLLQKAATKGTWGIAHSAIINITSDFGSISKPDFPGSWGGWLPYKVSKAGLNQFTHTLADDLDPEGILSVCYHPGWVQTELGGPDALIDVEESCSLMVESFTKLTRKENGGYFDWKGNVFPW